MTLAPTGYDVVQFRPSRVDGLADVDEVRVHRDRLELRSAGRWVTIRFLSFATGRDIGSGLAPIGELHFSKSHYPDSHFVFYAEPRLVIYMPPDGPTAYPDSHFWRVQELLRRGWFRLYGDAAPATPSHVLRAHPGLTALYVLIVFALAWLYALSGFLPGEAGETMRRFLLSNPSNPAIGTAFVLPPAVAAILLSLQYGRTARARVAIIGLSYTLGVGSEWAMRQAIHSWAPLERPPFHLVFWSAHRLGATLLIVTAATLVAASWRRAYLEPIPDAERGRVRTT